MKPHFIRTYESPFGIDRIDHASIFFLFDRHHTVTSLVLDTNVLIDMAQIVMRGNHPDLLKGHRISGLVDFLKNAPPMAVNIMPGIAFDEFPKGYVGVMNDYFQAFCAKHLPGWCDTPDCIPVGDDALNVAQETIHSLPPAYMAGMAVPYCLILKINMLHRMKHLSAKEKFDTYIDYACNQLNCLSFKETEIAKHCFFDQYEPNEIKPELFRKIRDNFTKNGGKNPQNFADVARIALNGTFDLTLLETPAFLLGKSKKFGEYNQDYWLVSYDNKLQIFSTCFHYDVTRGVKGLAGFIRELPIYKRSDWFYFDHKHMTNNWMRAMFKEGVVDTDKSIQQIEQEAKTVFGE